MDKAKGLSIRILCIHKKIVMDYKFKVNSMDNVDLIVNTIKEYGICIIEDFIPNIDDIKKESLSAIKKHNKKSKKN